MKPKKTLFQNLSGAKNDVTESHVRCYCFSQMFQNESAIIKYGAETISLSRGKPGHVEFNWMKVWELRQRLGKDFDPAKIAFYHVHPPGFAAYSALDVECVKGFNLALGYPVFFAIVLFNTPDLNSVKHTLLSYRYLNGKMRNVDPFFEEDPATTQSGAALTERDLVLLKACSYAEEVE